MRTMSQLRERIDRLTREIEERQVEKEMLDDELYDRERELLPWEDQEEQGRKPWEKPHKPAEPEEKGMERAGKPWEVSANEDAAEDDR